CRRRFPSRRSSRFRPEEAAAAAPVDEHRLEVRLRAAGFGAILRRDADVIAEVAQRHAAASRSELQSALVRPLLLGEHVAVMAGRGDLRPPLERRQLAGGYGVGEGRAVAGVTRIAAHGLAVARHLRELLAELEALALLPARSIAHAFENPAAQRPAQFSRGLAAEE